jgi:hypothetical protein
MAARTAAARTRTKVAETKAKSDADPKAHVHQSPTEAEVAEMRALREAQGMSLAELRKRYPHLTATAVREAVDGLPVPHGDPSKEKPRGGQRGVTTRRVRPVEPDYSKLPEAKAKEARAAFEKAHAEWKAGNTAEVRAAEKKVPAVRVPKQPSRKPARAAAKVKEARADAQPSDPKASDARKGRKPTDDLPDGWDWHAKGLPARILRLKTEGKGRTIKQVTEALGLPAREGVWHKVSLIYRAAADAKGLARPRRSNGKEAK